MNDNPMVEGPDATQEEAGASYAQYRQASAAQETLDWIRASRTQAAPRTPRAGPEEVPPEHAGALQNARTMRAGRALTDARMPDSARNVGFLDVVRGIMEVPTQAAAGAIEGARNTVRFADDVANWVLGYESGTRGPGAVIAENIPQPFSEADTAAGRVSRDIGKFLFGFWQGMRLTRGAAGVGGVAGAAGRATVAGAIGDALAQDPNPEQRLADLWKNAGLPQNVLTDYLAGEEGDTNLEGRLKNAIEGTVAGATAEALFGTVRLVRNAMRSRASAGQAAAAPAGQTLVEAAGSAPNVQRDVMLLGDPNRPLVEVSRGDATGRLADSMRATEGTSGPVVAAQLAAADQVAARPGPNVFVNWGRINTADDVKAAMRDMAEAFSGDIDQARRGVQTNEATKALADDLGMTVDHLLSRPRGSPWNAETALAARQLYAASGEQLLAAAKAAENGGTLELAAFRRAMAMHHAVQAEVISARTETARALQSWAIPAGSGREQLRAIEQALDSMGGGITAQAMARRLTMLAQNSANPVQAVGKFAAKGAMARSIEAIQEVWVAALLTSPATHIVNVTSNSMVALQQIAERRGAETVARLIGDGTGVAPGETMAMVRGLMGGWTDALRLAGKAWREEGDGIGAMLGKVDIPREPAVSAQRFGADPNSATGRAIDFVGHNMVRVPFRALGAEDAIFKSVNYRMELHAQAHRVATQEGLSGSAFRQRYADIVANPPEDLRLAAADQALYATFNRTTWGGWAQVARAGMELRERAPPLVFVLPFVRTPANIFSYGFERTPLAPLVGQWRADIAAGGARAEIAMARLSMGTMAIATAFDLADQGLVTGRGPDDPGEREAMTRQGIQPYSIKIGNTWVSYNRLDPIAMPLAIAADIRDLVIRGDIEPKEVDQVMELVAAGIATVSQFTLNKSWMQGVANLAEAVGSPEQNARQFITQMAGSVVPAGAAALARGFDPVQRDPATPGEAILARIAGMSETIQPRRDLWGRVVRPGLDTVAGNETVADVVNALSPMRMQQERAQPIDQELVRQNFRIDRIGWRVSFGDGADVDMRDFPQARDDLIRLAGNDLKIDGKGLMDRLNDLVTGRDDRSDTYRARSDGREGGKEVMIKGIVEQYRAAARQEVLKLHPDLRRFVEERIGERIERRTPPDQRTPGSLNAISIMPE